MFLCIYLQLHLGVRFAATWLIANLITTAVHHLIDLGVWNSFWLSSIHDVNPLFQ